MYKPHERRTYLAIGDSTTWTVGQIFYNVLLTKSLSNAIGTVSLINKGIGGTDSRRLGKIFGDYAMREPFDLITICVGMNDCANNKILVAEFSSNVGEMVEKVRRYHPRAEIILVSPATATEPTRVNNLATYRTAMQGVATNKGTLYYDPSVLWTTSLDDSYVNTRQWTSGNRFTYKGTWNASTNLTTPSDGSTGAAIVSATIQTLGLFGDYYRVLTAGTSTIDGISSWAVDDAIIWNGTAWVKRLASTITWSNVRQVMRYKGDWDASTNTTTHVSGETGSTSLTSGTGTVGEWYKVSVTGTTTIDTIATWAVNEVIYFNGTVWKKDILDWIHPIQAGHDLWGAGLYTFMQSNSNFYKSGL